MKNETTFFVQRLTQKNTVDNPVLHKAVLKLLQDELPKNAQILNNGFDCAPFETVGNLWITYKLK